MSAVELRMHPSSITGTGDESVMDYAWDEVDALLGAFISLQTFVLPLPVPAQESLRAKIVALMPVLQESGRLQITFTGAS